MKTRMVEERIGEDCGPIDWTHPLAKDMPAIWREAEANPEGFVLDTGTMTDKPILAIRMYDGWPSWRPRPALLVGGTLGPEWIYFDSYGVRSTSVRRRT